MSSWEKYKILNKQPVIAPKANYLLRINFHTEEGILSYSLFMVNWRGGDLRLSKIPPVHYLIIRFIFLDNTLQRVNCLATT